MNLCIQLAAAVLLLSAVNVNGRRTFVRSKSIPRVRTPAAAAGLEDDKNGFVKVLKKKNLTKWMQTIEGIPIYGAVLTTHDDEEGQITQVEGFVSQTASLVDTRPVVDERTALDTVRDEWNHNLDNLVFDVEPTQLQILQADDGWDKLVWKVAYRVGWKNHVLKEKDVGPVPAYIIALVNAQTGVVERTWNNIQFTKIPAIIGNKNTGKEFVNIDVEKEGSIKCAHRDASRRVEVFDIWNREQISSTTTSKFDCDKADNPDWDRFWLTGGYSPRNEAFLYATQFVDMWKDLTDNVVEPYETSTSWIRFYVHYGQQYENAFFDGDSFKFGDGKDVFYPMTSLDVVCHEIGHSITQWHGADLEYRWQSGGMNEAYSDVVGETCDIYYKNRDDGLVGTDIMRPDNELGTSLRSMCDPPSVGGSLDHMDQYNHREDVHSTSGIYNKAWCTLKSTDGWDYKMAFEVFTDANLFYWTPIITMHCGACGVETAAVDRGYKSSDVTAAFQVVGVSCSKCEA